MEPQPQAFFVDFLNRGDIEMSFRAFLHPRETAIFNVRAVDADHRPTGRHLVFCRDLHDFLLSPHTLRARLVSDTMSRLTCFGDGDTAASRFWADRVSRRCVEGALARHRRCPCGRGVRFAVEFRVLSAAARRVDGSLQQMQSRREQNMPRSNNETIEE